MAAMWDVTINAQGQSDFGLYGYSLAALGQSTFGFVWPCDAIWSPGDQVITTVWSHCPDPNANVETCDD